MIRSNKFVVVSSRVDVPVGEASEGRDRVIDVGSNDPIMIILQILITEIGKILLKFAN